MQDQDLLQVVMEEMDYLVHYQVHQLLTQVVVVEQENQHWLQEQV
jgi:hypothetical protein